MVSFDPNLHRQNALGIDRVKLRLLTLGILVVVAFVALFSRLWFLQVLASEDYLSAAKENRIRKVQTEPPRGWIRDRNGRVLVRNRKSLSVTVDLQALTTKRQERVVLRRLSELLDVPYNELRRNLHAPTVSPYKPVAVANDVREDHAAIIEENPEDFPAVDYEKLPVREYPRGMLAAQILGYVNEISPEELKSDFATGARPGYRPGDIVGKAGIERTYDRLLRGRPGVDLAVVNSTGRVVEFRESVQAEEQGKDLVLTLDADIQEITENALENGINSARGAGYEAPAGGVVVMDPTTGDVIAMASYPTYDPSILADGITEKEFAGLGAGTPDDPDDDAMLNRTIQGGFPPGSTFKIVTAGAALATGIADISTFLPCPGAKVYPPEGGIGSQVFNNWTSVDFGSMGFEESLEVSCDTFYYELGWRMESEFGPPEAAGGDGSNRFQKYARLTGFDHETGIDLPSEFDGVIPDDKWCQEQYEATKDTPFPTCEFGWLPGFTVNMAIGQGDVLVTPLQMAVSLAAIANGGSVVEPRLAGSLQTAADEQGFTEIVREFEPKTVRRLPLDSAEIEVIQEGLEDVISGSEGTAAGAFAGFPLEEFPLAGKTGTAEIGNTDKNYAWFISYGPTDDVSYVISVYIERAGHGGESAAPVARQIWEGILLQDLKTDVQLSSDEST
jgi:penicillin-binding protein 2